MTIRRIMFHVAIVFSLLLSGCGRSGGGASLPDDVEIKSQIPAGISWASLLFEAADLDSLTTDPLPCERSLLFSSSADSEKVSLAHLAPEVLGDLDHGFFLRIDEGEGYVEATLAETTGAGFISWIWSANPVGTAVLYVDNEKFPVIRMPFASLLAGNFLPVQYPYASATSYGHNLHFPIVHRNSCRLAIRVSSREELSELFYRVAWNSLDQNALVHPFDPASVQSSAPLLGSLAEKWTKPTLSTNGTSRTTHFTLEANSSKTLLDCDKSGTIRLFEVVAPNKAALADLWIEARWDRASEPAVSSPLSMLAGVSPKCEDTHSMSCTVSGGRVTLRWPMPCSQGATITCLNKGSSRASDLEVHLLFDESQGERAGTQLRFHANYVKREKRLLPIMDNILTLGDITGPGRIVGCNLRVDSLGVDWWGEGDEIIWLDQYGKAAWWGTGTEDYFGFAWCSDKVFHHPLRGQTRSDGGRSSHRMAAMHRYHLLDRLPFHQFAKFEMEVCEFTESFVEYETTLIWYAPLELKWSVEP